MVDNGTNGKIYPLVNKQFASENGPVEIVDLPINSMVIFRSYVTVYQRVTIQTWNLQTYQKTIKLKSGERPKLIKRLMVYRSIHM